MSVVGTASQNSIKVLAHGPKEILFSQISRSLSGGTTAFTGPGTSHRTIRSSAIAFLGYKNT